MIILNGGFTMKKLMFVICVMIAFMISCGDNTKIGFLEKGTKGGECYPNDTCNEGLICVEDVCKIGSGVDSDSVGEDSESDIDIVEDSDSIVIDEDGDSIEDLEVDYDAVEDSDSIVIDENDDSIVEDDVIEDLDVETPDADMVGWTKYNDLYWSEASSETMTFKNANTYCKNMGARVPTINELRGVSTCEASSFDGDCKFTEECSSIPECWDGCEKICAPMGYGYGFFKDQIELWASTIGVETNNNISTSYYIYINFLYGSMTKTIDIDKLIYIRCVK